MPESENTKHPNHGNQFAAKDPSQRVTGKGRLNVDLGDLKPRLVRAAQGGKLKPIVIEILEEGLKKRGF
jgi:hypothetical protein